MPDSKFCSSCSTDKPLTEFYRQSSKKDGVQSCCKVCSGKYNRKHMDTLRDRVFNKLGHRCAKCGFSDKRALQIDHVNGGGVKEYKKIKFGQGKLLRLVLKDRENKYQILCANCNRIKRFENKEV